MNARLLLFTPLTFFVVPFLFGQSDSAPQPGVPVTQAPPPDTTLLTPPAGEDQRVYGTRWTTLVTPEAAQALVTRFRTAYGQTNSPRIVIYVNRALVETESGLKLTGRTEKVHETVTANKDAATATTTETSGESTYATSETAAAPTLADRQTVREVERLFGRVFRNAGAQLADQKAASALATDQPGVRVGSGQNAKDRDALKQIADIAVEVLISSRALTVPGISGDSTYTVPDIQATAIRLSDSAIVGQAAASDVLGGAAQAGRVARRFGVSDITEATAFALMEDMLTGAK